MRDFSVSVCMITYNHEKFIAQAIEGVMMQETDFPVHLIIGEDFSSDNTRKICLDYKAKYPDRITLLLPEKNLGGNGGVNFLATVDLATQGYKYVAMCEGDDYWIDAKKLQNQVDCIEANRDCGMVYTDIKEFHEATQEFRNAPGHVVPDDKVVAELINQKYIHFPTLLLRSDMFREIMTVFASDVKGNVIGDTRIILEFAQRAKVCYVPDVTTVYRIVTGSQTRPPTTDRAVFVANDTYQTRKNFVLRYGLDKKVLGIPVCNFNRNIINNAAVQKNYGDSLKFLSHLKIKDTFEYCDFNTFRTKMGMKMLAKLFLSLVGVNALRNSGKK